MKHIDGIHNPEQIKISYARFRFIGTPKLSDILRQHIDGPFKLRTSLIERLRKLLRKDE